MDGMEVFGAEAEGQADGGGSRGGGVTVKVRVGSHDCWVGFRAATRLGRRYYYRCVRPACDFRMHVPRAEQKGSRRYAMYVCSARSPPHV